MADAHDLAELVMQIAEAADSLAANPPADQVYPLPESPEKLARLIDHTLLKPTATEKQIRQLCLEALEHHFVTVCVNPVWVSLCNSLLSGSDVGVCTVIGFPLGATTSDVKVFEAQQCMAGGARELDMVINIGALQSADFAAVYSDISAMVQPVHAGSASLKVIIEAAFLTDREKIAACLLAKSAGADYVKTSTGFGPGGATAQDVALMRRVVGAETGVKAAGGVRTLADCNAMIAAGASRIGSSSGVSIMHEARA